MALLGRGVASWHRRHVTARGAGFDLGFFSLQPSEFAKLAFILALAHFLSRPPDELRLPLNFWKAIGMMALPFVLDHERTGPRLGAGVHSDGSGDDVCRRAHRANICCGWSAWSGCWPGVVPGGRVVCAAGLVQIKLEEYQRQRLLVYFGRDFASAERHASEKGAGPSELQHEKSYKSRQAMISVGSGGFWGKGWRQGNQTALGFLPPARGAQRFHFLRHCRGERIRRQRDRCSTLYAVVLFTGIEDRRPGARSPGQSAGGGSRDTPVQPRIHQHRHEHSH